VVVATYIKLLLKNIGGSEKFEDKKGYFYTELKGAGTKLGVPFRKNISVKRDAIIKDVYFFVFVLLPFYFLFLF